MTDESKPAEVSRRIEAPTALIFEILANPQRHMDFDGSDMLQGADFNRPISDALQPRSWSLTDVATAIRSGWVVSSVRRCHRAVVGYAALLIRHGIKVLSQRDHRTVDAVLGKLDPAHHPNPDARDHYETKWFIDTIGPAQ